MPLPCGRSVAAVGVILARGWGDASDALLGACSRNGLNRGNRGWEMGQSASGPYGVQETWIREGVSRASFLLVMAERTGATIPRSVPQAVATC